MALKSSSAPSPSDLSAASLAITEHAPVPMAMVEGESLIVRQGNPAFCRLMGRSLEELLGKPFAALLPDREKCVASMVRVARTRQPETFTEEDGSKSHPVFWSFTIWPVAAQDGLLGVMIQVTETGRGRGATVAMNEALVLGSRGPHELTEAAENLNARLRTEIDERQRAERAARESEERFRAWMLSSSDVVYRMSADWGEMRELIGRDYLATATGPSRTWLEDYVSPEDRPAVSAAIAEAVRTQGVFELTHRVRRLDGTLGWMLSRAVPLLDAAGAIREWFGTATDVTERKQTEDALRTSEERYRTLFNSIDEGYCMIEMLFDERGKAVDWLFLEVNPSFLKLTGLSVATGKRVLELIPDHEAHWFETYGRVALTGEPVRFVNEAKGLDGRWFDLFAFRIGRPGEHKVAVLFTNITERKRVEEALRRSEARFATIVAQATAGIAEVDRSGRFTLVNERFATIVGRSRREVESLHMRDLVHPDDLPACIAGFDSVAGGAPVYESEKRYIRPNGIAVWVSQSVARLSDGENREQAFVEVAQDISVRKRLELALQASETYFRELTQALPCGVWTSLPEGRVDFINRYWLDYTGQTFRHAMAHPEVWADAIHPEDRAETERIASAGREAGESYTLEARFRQAKSGEYRWFLKRSMPVRDAEGAMQKRIGVCIDIDDLKRAQDLLGDHADELSALVDARTAELRETIGELEAFSYSVSHDLRAPLRSMQGFTQMLLESDRLSLDTEAADYLRRIHVAAGRMDALIRDVLTYSRLLRSEIVPEPVSLDALVRSVLDTYPLRVNGAQITIVGTLPVVLANEAGLTQCVSNLLANAVKFTAPGVPARVNVHADEIDGDARLWVEDNGIGIDLRDQRRIWDIFTQVERSKDGQGTGIGLAIVRKAVDRMGGQVGLESIPGHGSRFWLRLPRAPTA